MLIIMPDNGQYLVVEVIAQFADFDRATAYVRSENSTPAALPVASAAPDSFNASVEIATLKPRETALLQKLSELMDANNCVEIRNTELAKRIDVPSGSMHGIISSLREKGRIEIVRQGTVTNVPIYQVISQ